MFNMIGIVTSGNNAACDLINNLQEIIKYHKLRITIPFVISNKFPLDEGKITNNNLKVINIENDNCKKSRERIYEYHLGEFTKFPCKKLLFIEYENQIPECIKNHYECYSLQPSVKEKTGTWENILGEVLLTKSDNIGCYIKKDNVPVMYHKISTKDFNWQDFNRKNDITKERLYLSLQKSVRESMLYVSWLFFDLLSNHEIKTIENKTYIDNLLVIGGINASGFINSKRNNNERNCGI